MNTFVSHWNTRAPAWVPCRLVWLAVLHLLGPAAVAADSEVHSPDVYRRVVQLAAEVDEVRIHIGRPAVDAPAFSVEGASSRAVYSLAQAVYEKTNRLVFELTRTVGQDTTAAPLDAQPVHVLGQVLASRARLASLRESLGLHHGVPLSERDPSRSPTDVYSRMQRISRQLDAMLARPIQASDVFEKVSLAVAYVEAIQRTVGGESLELQPPFELAKFPLDVYVRQVDCYRSMKGIALLLDEPALRLESASGDRSRVYPGDMYDLSMLLVAELRHLGSRLGFNGSLRSHRVPARIFPAHVFQRAGRLEAQLKRLAVVVSERSVAPAGAR